MLLSATALVDQTSPPETAARWRRFGWLLVEILLCSLVVRTQGTLIRPALIYLLPVGRAILLLGERAGLLASLLVWVAYAVNILPGAWPDHLGDFQSLVMALRETEARRYTLIDTPIYTCIHRPVAEALGLLG